MGAQGRGTRGAHRRTAVAETIGVHLIARPVGAPDLQFAQLPTDFFGRPEQEDLVEPPSAAPRSAGEVGHAREKGRTRVRSGVLANSSLLLVGASGVSYLTTFVRERYFYQRAYGTNTLDRLEVALSVAAIVSNLVGMLLAFWWSSGRFHNRRTMVALVASISAAGLVSIPFPAAGCLVGVLIASSVFLWGCQRAAARGRQAYALLGAITAPGLTITSWQVIGIDRPTKILLGYLVGSAWQAAVAVAVGRGAALQRSEHRSSMAWPLFYMLAVQVDAVLDQAALLSAGRGWAGAGALAFNLLGAATVIVIGPLGAQALAGRLDLSRLRAIALPTVAITAAYLLAVPVVLPLVIKGGSVAGSGYHRIVVLSMLYGLAIPFSIFWQLRTRASHRDALQWPSIAREAAFLFVVHVAVLAVVVAARAWELVPLATVLAFVVACGRLVRRAPIPVPAPTR